MGASLGKPYNSASSGSNSSSDALIHSISHVARADQDNTMIITAASASSQSPSQQERLRQQEQPPLRPSSQTKHSCVRTTLTTSNSSLHPSPRVPGAPLPPALAPIPHGSDGSGGDGREENFITNSLLHNCATRVFSASETTPSSLEGKGSSKDPTRKNREKELVRENSAMSKLNNAAAHPSVQISQEQQEQQTHTKAATSCIEKALVSSSGASQLTSSGHEKEGGGISVRKVYVIGPTHPTVDTTTGVSVPSVGVVEDKSNSGSKKRNHSAAVGKEDSKPKPPPPTVLATEGVICLQGKLVRNTSDELSLDNTEVHRISGLWALEGLSKIVNAPDNCERFEYEHKCSGNSAVFPLSGRYTGFIYTSDHLGERTKTPEQDVYHKFIKNSEGYYNVEGQGSNVFGKYSITGILQDSTFTITRIYQTLKEESSKKSVNSKLAITGPDTLKDCAELQAALLTFDDVDYRFDCAFTPPPPISPPKKIIEKEYTAANKNKTLTKAERQEFCLQENEAAKEAKRLLKRQKEQKRKAEEEASNENKRMKLEHVLATNKSTMAAIAQAAPDDPDANVTRSEYNLLVQAFKEVDQIVSLHKLVKKSSKPVSPPSDVSDNQFNAPVFPLAEPANQSMKPKKKKTKKIIKSRSPSPQPKSLPTKAPVVEDPEPLSFKEQEALSEAINLLPECLLPGAMQIIREAGFVNDDDDEIDLDLDQLDTITQRKLQSHAMKNIKTKEKKKDSFKKSKDIVKAATILSSPSSPHLKEPTKPPTCSRPLGGMNFFALGDDNDNDDDKEDDADFTTYWDATSSTHDTTKKTCCGGATDAAVLGGLRRHDRTEKEKIDNRPRHDRTQKEESGKGLHESVGTSRQNCTQKEDRDSDGDSDDSGGCEICNKIGEMIVCDGGDHVDGCDKLYHIHCIGRSVFPPGDWICNVCAREQGIDVGLEGYEYENEDEVKESTDRKSLPLDYSDSTTTPEVLDQETTMNITAASASSHSTPQQQQKQLQQQQPPLHPDKQIPQEQEEHQEQKNAATAYNVKALVSSSGVSQLSSSTQDGLEGCSRDTSRSGMAAEVVWAKTSAATAYLSEIEKKEKENFIMFTRVLLKYLEQRDPKMHQRAKNQIRECYEKNKIGDPMFRSLTLSIEHRLRITVGDVYFKKAQVYLNNFIEQNAARQAREISTTTNLNAKASFIISPQITNRIKKRLVCSSKDEQPAKRFSIKSPLKMVPTKSMSRAGIAHSTTTLTSTSTTKPRDVATSVLPFLPAEKAATLPTTKTNSSDIDGHDSSDIEDVTEIYLAKRHKEFLQRIDDAEEIDDSDEEDATIEQGTTGKKRKRQSRCSSSRPIEILIDEKDMPFRPGFRALSTQHLWDGSSHDSTIDDNGSMQKGRVTVNIIDKESREPLLYRPHWLTEDLILTASSNFRVKGKDSMLKSAGISSVTFKGILANVKHAAFFYKTAGEQCSQMASAYLDESPMKNLLPMQKSRTRATRNSYALGIVKGLDNYLKETLRNGEKIRECKLMRVQKDFGKGEAYDDIFDFESDGRADTVKHAHEKVSNGKPKTLDHSTERENNAHLALSDHQKRITADVTQAAFDKGMIDSERIIKQVKKSLRNFVIA